MWILWYTLGLPPERAAEGDFRLSSDGPSGCGAADRPDCGCTDRINRQTEGSHNILTCATVYAHSTGTNSSNGLINAFPMAELYPKSL